MKIKWCLNKKDKQRKDNLGYEHGGAHKACNNILIL